MSRSWTGWIPVVLVCAGIFALSSSAIEFPVGGFASTLMSIAAHLVEYAVLGFFARRALRLGGAEGTRATGWAICFALAYGGTDEIHQAFVPGRSATALDLIPDFVGAAAGAVAAQVLERFRRASRTSRHAGSTP